MNTTEIVMSKVQSDSGLMVRQFLTERIGQPRQAANLHSHGQVASLNKTGRDVFGIGIAGSHLGYNPLDWTWGVSPVRSVVLPIVAKHFCEFSEISISSKARGNRVSIVVQSVCRDLC